MIEKIFAWIGIISFLITGLILSFKLKNYDLSALSMLYAVANWILFIK